MTKTIYLEIELEVEFTRHKATRGYRNSMGVPEEPDEDESIEIDKVLYNGKELELLPDDLEWLQQKLEDLDKFPDYDE